MSTSILDANRPPGPPAGPDPDAPPPDAATPNGPPPRLDLHDETGAQSMEYAMLGGAGVAGVSLITWLLQQDWMRDLIQGLLTTVFEKLSETLFNLPFFG